MSQQKDLELLSYIAQKLKTLRAMKNVSQQDVLNDTNIHIARIETGKLNVSVSTLSQLCKYFNITLTDFFNSTDKN